MRIPSAFDGVALAIDQIPDRVSLGITKVPASHDFAHEQSLTQLASERTLLHFALSCIVRGPRQGQG